MSKYKIVEMEHKMGEFERTLRDLKNIYDSIIIVNKSKIEDLEAQIVSLKSLLAIEKEQRNLLAKELQNLVTRKDNNGN